MTAYLGPTVCLQCGVVIQAAQPGHESDAVSHGICAVCLPAYRAEMGLPAKEQARRTA